MGGTGWVDDGIRAGTITLFRRGADYDLKIGDATGSFSAQEDGAKILARQGAGVIQVVAIYPSFTVETFLFSAPSRGRTTLAWTSSKRTGAEDRASVFVSSCIMP